MEELRDLMEEQLVVGGRRLDGRQEEDNMQMGVEAARVDHQEDEIVREGLAKERQRARHGLEQHVAQLGREQRGAEREQRIRGGNGGHDHGCGGRGGCGHGRGGRGGRDHGRGGHGRRDHGRGGHGRRDHGRGGRGHGRGGCCHDRGVRGHEPARKRSWVCPRSV